MDVETPTISRRPPVVIQTSSLDCGPASLAALMRGLGCPASYEALRDICATDVDGTSIDSMESVAVAAGLDAEQLVVPAEQVLALPQEYLPAIAVVTLADGFPHFVVVWRCTRRYVVVMDPAMGMRRIRRDVFVGTLYRHTIEVPAGAWREWAGSQVFIDGLQVRLQMLGKDRKRQPAVLLLSAVVGDPGCEALARLDGAIRLAEQGDGAALDHIDQLPWDAAGDPAVFSCLPADDLETVRLTGAVIVRAQRWIPGNADPIFAKRLAVVEPEPWQILWRMLPAPRRSLMCLVLLSVVLAGFAVGQKIALRGLLDTDAHAPGPILISAVLLGGCAATIVTLIIAHRGGRQLELLVRQAWWDAVARLPDRFVRTRPASDLSERGHLLHRVRELPDQAVRAVTAVAVAVGASATATVVAPRSAIYLVLLLLVVVAIPLISFKVLAEGDFQVRSLAGVLNKQVCDSLIGAEAVAAFGAAGALRHEHETGLAAWRRAQMKVILIRSLLRGVSGTVAAVFAGLAITNAHVGFEAGLLVSVLALMVIGAGFGISDSISYLIDARSSIARAVGPLSAVPPSDSIGEPGLSGESLSGPSSLAVADLSVELGALTVLKNIDLVIPAGCHAAVVGASGSGKSSLLSAVLGWLEPTVGSVVLGWHEPSRFRSVAAWTSAETAIWNTDWEYNVGFGAADDAPSALTRVALAEATGIVQRLAQRGDQRLGDNGAALSSGEGQRVRFARCLGRPDAPVVLFDEPFRGLGADTAANLMKTARQTWQKSALLCVMHDVQQARDFDMVIVMDRGQIVEVGPPAELERQDDSRFRALLTAQKERAYQGFLQLNIARARP